MPRKYQIAFSRFVSGHMKALTFRQGQKIFPERHLCYSELVSPVHILTCLDFIKDEVLLALLLFLDFLDLWRLPSIARQSGIRNNSNNKITCQVDKPNFTCVLRP
ncbi:hypothetical protein TNCV_2721881 [Trichonephila clavipes]|nr:hypothetical protein TNCV_2721881 [Trichonephila clavipes]